jgi:hypothetical protein
LFGNILRAHSSCVSANQSRPAIKTSKITSKKKSGMGMGGIDIERPGAATRHSQTRSAGLAGCAIEGGGVRPGRPMVEGREGGEQVEGGWNDHSNVDMADRTH